MRLLRIFSRILVGVVFIFSGFVKAVDPLGSTYKFLDYFVAFNIDFLSALALPLAITQNILELIIGIALVIGLKMKETGWAVFIFMTFYLPLTLIIAIYNPVTDCGCFGDALVLTNWQTFWKNVILYIPTLIVFFQRKKFVPAYNSSAEWRLIIFYILVGTAFSIYNYRNLPLLDFRPYKLGSDIVEKMSRPEGSPVDEYEFSFIYEKDGVPKEFSLENLPDSTWSWVETKQKLIKRGYVPPIHDFSLTSADGVDITSDVLSYNGYSFLIVSYDLSKSDLNSFLKINRLKEQLNDKANFYGLTSSTEDVISAFKDKVKPEFDFYATDEITLKTIIRSNPGLVLLKEGVVIGKWHHRNIPDFKSNLLSFSLDQMKKQNSNLIVFLISSIFLLSVSVFHLFLRDKNNV